MLGHAPEVVCFGLQLDQTLLDAPELLQIDRCDVARQVEEDPADSPGHSCQLCIKSTCVTDQGQFAPLAMYATAAAEEDARFLPTQQGRRLPVATMSAASSTSSSKGGGFSSAGNGMSSSEEWACPGRGALSCRKRSQRMSRNLRELALLGSNSRHLSA